MGDIEVQLAKFSSRSKIRGKGPLSVVLVLTRKLRDMSPPFNAESLLAPQKGQVAGLGKAAVQKILKDHGIDQVLAEEGGRTSRGSIQNMNDYIVFLNELTSRQNDPLDFIAMERWWIARIKEFFESKPFRLRIDQSKSIRSIVADLIESAFTRQKKFPGVMVVGAVMQHLVGAKIQTALPNANVEHEGFSVADAPSGRKGDFLIGDTAIHVTTAPSEALIRKCCDNLAQSLRPLIITTSGGVGGALALAKNANVADRIDILEIEQFIATNVYEWTSFEDMKRAMTVSQLVNTYNHIIDTCETDHSLKITIG